MFWASIVICVIICSFKVDVGVKVNDRKSYSSKDLLEDIKLNANNLKAETVEKLRKPMDEKLITVSECLRSPFYHIK